MKKLPLVDMLRFLARSDCTLGRIIAPTGFECVTIERPWKGNAPWISCIPEGLYECKVDKFGQGVDAYPDLRLLSVPGRTDIEMHAANFAHELDGCIAVGDSIKVGKPRGVCNSRDTLKALLDSLGGAEGAYLWIHGKG